MSSWYCEFDVPPSVASCPDRVQTLQWVWQRVYPSIVETPSFCFLVNSPFCSFSLGIIQTGFDSFINNFIFVQFYSTMPFTLEFQKIVLEQRGPRGYQLKWQGRYPSMVYVEVIKSWDVGSECPRARLNIFVTLLTAFAVDCFLFARFVEVGPWKYSKRGFLRAATIITVLGRLYAWNNRRSWGWHVLRRASRAHHVQRRRHEDLSNPFFLRWHNKPAPRLRSLSLVVRDWDGDVCARGVRVGSSLSQITLINIIDLCAKQ